MVVSQSKATSYYTLRRIGCGFRRLTVYSSYSKQVSKKALFIYFTIQGMVLDSNQPVLRIFSLVFIHLSNNKFEAL